MQTEVLNLSLNKCIFDHSSQFQRRLRSPVPFQACESAGKPHENTFLIWRLLGGHIQKNIIFARRQPNHVKNLLSGLYNLL
jgi:hypothetical protein